MNVRRRKFVLGRFAFEVPRLPLTVQKHWSIILSVFAKRYLRRYQNDMTQYDDICEEAIGNYGLISTERAAELGVHRKELYDWVRLGRMEKCGRGLYRITHYLPTEYDHYAMAVALVGGEAWLWGDAVLAMHNLALVNPVRYKVATKRNVRRELPEWIEVVHRFDKADVDEFNGIPCQNLASVFIDYKDSLMRDRILQAIQEASNKSLLNVSDMERLRKVFAL